MKKISYYPGCTLINKAKGLNALAKECVKVLDWQLLELDNWYCCQANFSQVSDNIMNHLSSVRTLAQARKQGEKLVTLCSTCYYVLKRVNLLMTKDEGKRKTAFDFIEEEYGGPVEVIHFLEFLRDDVGFDNVQKKVKTTLSTLAIAPYYGCQLLRPAKELSFDDPYSPAIYENFLTALGCKVINYPFKTECCGSFLTTFSQNAVEDCVYKIINSAVKSGAEFITTSCPLCNFNLDWSQTQLSKRYEGFKPIPILYLTELMALALGVDVTSEIWGEHIVEPVGF